MHAQHEIVSIEAEDAVLRAGRSWILRPQAKAGAMAIKTASEKPAELNMVDLDPARRTHRGARSMGSTGTRGEHGIALGPG
jgi:hypothetical protein